MSERKEKVDAMRARLKEFSQGPTTDSAAGPLPGVAYVGTDEKPPLQVSSLPPMPPEEQPNREWRSQGITVYSVDDARLERLAQFFKSRRVRFGRRGQISLLAGAGIAALEHLLDVDPGALLEIVQNTMREREGMSTRSK
jgi:hypothetical protein